MPNPVLHSTPPSPSPIKQIDGLQALRAVAVILVAWFHTSEFCGSVIGRNLPTLGVYGIDIFFVISGFIMATILLRSAHAPSPPSALHFLKRRLLRIFPIYWIFASLSAIVLAHRHELLQHNFIPSFFLLPWVSYPDFPLLVGFSWTLVFELIFYCVIFLVLLVRPRQAVPIATVFILFLVAIGLVIDIRRPVLIAVLNPLLLEFVFGCAIGMLYHRFGSRKRLGLILLTVGGVMSFCLHALPFPTADGIQMVVANLYVFARVSTWGVAAACVVAGTVFWSPALNSASGRLMVIIGNASYSAYLASALVVEKLIVLFVKAVPQPRAIPLPAQVLLQCLFVLAILAVGWLSYQFVEWPLLRWGQRFIHTRSASAS